MIGASGFQRIFFVVGFVFALWSNSVRAQPLYDHFYIDAGVYIPSILERFSAPSGYKDLVSPVKGILSLRYHRPITLIFAFEPAVSVLVPWRNSLDGNARTFTIMVPIDFSLRLNHFMRWRIGIGGNFEITTSRAEAVSLNNGGTDIYSTFYTPGGVHGTAALFLGTGVAFRPWKTVDILLDFNLTSIASSKRRRVAGIIALGLRL